MIPIRKIYLAIAEGLVALVLLVLNGRSDLVGRKNRNSVLVSLLLICTLAFFALMAWLKIEKTLFA